MAWGSFGAVQTPYTTAVAVRASAENLFSPFSADLLSIYHCQPAAASRADQRGGSPARLLVRSKDGEKGEMYFLHSIGSMFGFGRAKAPIIHFHPRSTQSPSLVLTKNFLDALEQE